MARARRISLFEREVRVRLAPAGLDVLFDEMRVLTEGQIDGERYFGSTMMTVDLARVQPRVSDECDPACARRIVDLAADDERVRARARRIALDQAQRTGDLESPAVDLHVHRDGRILHLDLDVEAISSGAKRRCEEVARRPAPGDLEPREAIRWRKP
jgi:hypothetical protein